jgi:cytoskeletal protein CcmA (bactofilin family)
MMFREKDTKSRYGDGVHEVVTPLSDLSGTTPPPYAERASGLSRTPATAPFLSARTKSDPKTSDPKTSLKADMKRLIVGPGISLKGKISSCDRLVIEGDVEAELENCHTVEVSENGTFKGAAEIAGAEISGNYEGSLTVRENLLIRGTGHVSGTVRYGRLHIEDGGEINGDLKSMVAAPPKLLSETEN